MRLSEKSNIISRVKYAGFTSRDEMGQLEILVFNT